VASEARHGFGFAIRELTDPASYFAANHGAIAGCGRSGVNIVITHLLMLWRAKH
jgi:hypothetical protein